MRLSTLSLHTALCTSAILGFTFTAPEARAEESVEQLFENATPYVNARYRYEYRDQAGVLQPAHASTLRTRVGLKSGSFHGFSGVVEFENISHIGPDNYNDTINGRTNHTTVADVESTELNQMFLQFSEHFDSTIRIGRQAVNLDNQRFIGSVDWRQNNQTLDAITVTNSSIEDTKVTYGYVSRVNRIFSNESPVGNFESDSHIFNASNTSLPIGKVTVYAYLLDFKLDSPALSSQSYGIRLDGKRKLSDAFDFKYHFEYAMQKDYGDNTTNYNADYYHLAPAIVWNGITTAFGYEVLGSDNGTIGFSTPLSTLHKFNGWADQFLATPANGLRDAYLDITYIVSGITGDANFINGLLIKGQYHHFSADNGSADYGDEFGLYLRLPVMDNYFVEAKYADYNADQFSTDAQQFTFGIGLKF